MTHKIKMIQDGDVPEERVAALDRLPVLNREDATAALMAFSDAIQAVCKQHPQLNFIAIPTVMCEIESGRKGVLSSICVNGSHAAIETSITRVVEQEVVRELFMHAYVNSQLSTEYLISMLYLARKWNLTLDDAITYYEEKLPEEELEKLRSLIMNLGNDEKWTRTEKS